MIDRKTLVNAYGHKVKEVVIDDLGIEYKERANEALCPFHSEKTPSFKYNEKDYTWKCFGCGERFDIISHRVDNMGMSYVEALALTATEIGINPEIEDYSQAKRIEQKEYKKPVTKAEPIDEKIIKHFSGRGITEKTLKHWRVKTGIHSFKIDDEYKKRKCIIFECYDQYDDLVHASYRTSDKHFAQSTGSKAILWGMWHVEPKGTLYLVEGQIDAMTLWQCGIKNVVSIPSGANNSTYLQHNYDFLSRFDELVFWIDNDEAGHKAGEKFRSSFNDARIIKHAECKDANEVLLKLGCDEIKRFVNQPRPLPKGIKCINDASYDVEEAGEDKRIETGFSDFDAHVEDWRIQQLSVVFGRDNEGKSTVMSQIVTHQLKRKVKTFLYSAELGDQSIQDWLYRQLIGEGQGCYNKKQGKYEEKYYLKPEVLQAVREYTKDLLYILDKNECDIVEDNSVLFKRMGILAAKFGVKLFILDNLQSVLVQEHNDLNRDQSNFMEKCRRFAQTHHVHVVVVAHPHKVAELEVDENTVVGNLMKDNISGSKDISNKAHNIISIERSFEGKYFDMIITNLKDKKKGIRKGFKYRFDAKTNRFYNDEVPISENEEFRKLLPKTITYHNGHKQTFKKGEVG